MLSYEDINRANGRVELRARGGSMGEEEVEEGLRGGNEFSRSKMKGVECH